jgi:predicted nuclease of predicted toxin-antitoxin system
VKLKLDENIGRRGLHLLSAAGHDVTTVRDENLQGAADEKLFQVCCDEGRALITLDRDFGQVLRFPAHESAGLVVLDLGPRISLRALTERLQDFLTVLATRPLDGALWIVEPGRVRIHLRHGEE